MIAAFTYEATLGFGQQVPRADLISVHLAQPQSTDKSLRINESTTLQGKVN